VARLRGEQGAHRPKFRGRKEGFSASQGKEGREKTSHTVANRQKTAGGKKNRKLFARGRTGGEKERRRASGRTRGGGRKKKKTEQEERRDGIETEEGKDPLISRPEKGPPKKVPRERGGGEKMRCRLSKGGSSTKKDDCNAPKKRGEKKKNPPQGDHSSISKRN